MKKSEESQEVYMVIFAVIGLWLISLVVPLTWVIILSPVIVYVLWWIFAFTALGVIVGVSWIIYKILMGFVAIFEFLSKRGK